MADNDSSGAQPNPTPYWVADFNGDAKDELLFYVPEDDNWRLGAYDGTQLQWSLAGDTANFGHAINDGRPFWAGDFNGDQKVEVLFYYPGDNNWWLGVYNGNQFAWSQAGNTATLEQPGNEGPLFWIGAFSAATRLDVLYYDPDVDKWWLGTYSGNAFAWSDAGYRPTAEQGMTKRWATQPTAVNALITAFAPRVWLYPPPAWYLTRWEEEHYFPSSTEWYIQRVQLYQGWNTPNSHQLLEAHPTFAILGRYAADNQADVLFLDDGGNDTTRAGILPGTAGWPPPCYAHVAPVLDQPGVLEFQYWFFYTFNGDSANFVPGSWGEHVGDWEHIILRVEDMQTITQVFYSAHSGQEWQDGQKLSFVPGTQHPIVYAARHSHANYIDNGVAGFHMHIPVVGNDMTKMGTAWDTWHRVIRVEWSAVPTVNQQDWIRYTGRWGQTPHNSYGDSPNGPAAPGRADFRRMPSGTRLAEVSTPNTVYIIAGGVRFPSTQQTGAVIVPDGFIGAFPTCPPACPDDGTLLQEADNPQIWAIWLGEKRPMPSVLPPPSDWHYPFPWTNQVSVVPAGSLSSIPAASR